MLGISSAVVVAFTMLTGTEQLECRSSDEVVNDVAAEILCAEFEVG